jgi:hypothetical protein
VGDAEGGHCGSVIALAPPSFDESVMRLTGIAAWV